MVQDLDLFLWNVNTELILYCEGFNVSKLAWKCVNFYPDYSLIFNMFEPCLIFIFASVAVNQISQNYFDMSM